MRNSRPVTKGQLIAVWPGKTVTKNFMFNPNNVDDTKAVVWGSTEVPGASHPVYQFGSGGERVIAFDLFIDGDRGQVFASRQRAETSPTGLSIQPELLFYRSLEYPNKYNLGMEAVFPAVCFFSMGSLYKNVRVGVKKADFKVNFWTPKMEPVRATISLQLVELIKQSQTADEVLAGTLAAPQTAGLRDNW